MRARNTGGKRSTERAPVASAHESNPHAPTPAPAIPETAKPRTSAWAILVGACVIACLAAWFFPPAKPDAVLGRLSYGQFMLALLLTGLSASVVVVGLLPEPKRKPATFRLLAVVLGAGVVLLVGEAYARIWPPPHQMDNPWYLFTPKGVQASTDLPYVRPARLHWSGLSRGDLAILNDDDDPYATEVTFITDFEGFRNSADLKSADLAFLGDSFTEAGNVAEEDTFVQRTARARGLTARNLGRSGYSPPTELVVLKRHGLGCRPRCVIWQIAEDNDLHDAHNYSEWLRAGKPPWIFHDRAGQRTRDEGWQLRSPTYRLFARLRTPRPWPRAGTFTDQAGRDHEIRFLYLTGPHHTAVNHPGWPVLASALREGAEILQQQKIPLIVLHIPMKIRVFGSYVRMHDPDTREMMAGDWDIPPALSLSGQLATLCSELGVRYIDATPALRGSTAAGELVYLPFDTHLNVHGHQVVSDLLAEPLNQITPRP